MALFLAHLVTFKVQSLFNKLQLPFSQIFTCPSWKHHNKYHTVDLLPMRSRPVWFWYGYPIKYKHDVGVESQRWKGGLAGALAWKEQSLFVRVIFLHLFSSDHKHQAAGSSHVANPVIDYWTNSNFGLYYAFKREFIPLEPVISIWVHWPFPPQEIWFCLSREQ